MSYSVLSESDSDPEDFTQGVNGANFSDLREGSAGSPMYPTPIRFPTELRKGDHILFQTADPPFRPIYQSALVTGGEKEYVEILSYSRAGIYEDSVCFSAFRCLHKVEYTRCRHSAKKSVSRARWRMKDGKEDHYHALYNNSHCLVTWAKTGNEYLLSDVINGLSCDEGDSYPLLNPVLSHVILSHVILTSLSDMNPGDHMITGSQHYLVDSVNADCNTFTAYTVRGGRAAKEERTWSQGDKLLRVDYDQHSNSYHPGKALDMAGEEVEQKTKWEYSDCFVSKMKCGKAHMVTDKCLLRGNLEPVGCTCVSPHVSVDVGDHLVIRNTFGEFHSVLVYTCVNQSTIVSMPSVHKKEPMGKLVLADYNEVYRINYPQSLPVEEILKRCCSPEAEQMLLQEGGADLTGFVSWAKIGRKLSINVSKLIGTQQIAQIRPSEYEKILSLDEIQVGDHLFVPNLAYRWHFLVTEKIESGPLRELLFTVIYSLRGSVKETVEKIDPMADDVFRVAYPEEYPPSLAIKRARSLLGKIKLSPTARMWFVRWAKTGSDEGLEIDFLKRKSMPVAKSRITCFTQLNPADYLVEDRGRFYVRRHFLVTAVESANACIVIGAWKGRVLESRLLLDESVTVYHRIIYEEGTCVSSSEAIRRAREAITAPFRPKLFRRRFVNYVKTTDSVETDVGNLLEERTLLLRERVESANVLKPGDHIEQPVKALQRVSYSDMIVTVPLSDKKVMVLTLAPQDGKQKLTEIELDLTTTTSELYRVKYLERVDVGGGVEALRKMMKEGNPLPTPLWSPYFRPSTKTNYILMLATIGETSSIHVDPQVHKVLQCRKEDNRKPPSVSKVRSLSVEAGARASTNIAFKLGSRVLLHGTRFGQVVGFGPGLSLLAEAPFLTRRLYQLNRQRKFDQITEEDYKRGVIQQSFTSANTVLGATAGTIIGQVVIPIPIVGAAVGGTLGTIGGHGIGRLEGWAVSRLVRDGRTPTLPIIISFEFSEFPHES